MPIDVPEEYDPESAEWGYAQAMRDIGRTALANAEGLDPSDADADEDACPDCGSALLSSMGAAETSTPKGRVCPECEL